MKRFSLRSIPVALGLLFLASCNGSSSGGPNLGNLPGPQVPTGFMRLFVATCGGTNNIYIFAPPFSSTSASTGSFPNGCGDGIAFNPNTGMLAASTDGAGTNIFNPPYSSSTAKVATLTSGTSGIADQPAFDVAGNLWIPDPIAKKVFEFTPPFSNASAPVANNASVGTPVGAAINPAAGLMFVTDSSIGATRVVPAPYTGVPTATLAGPSPFGVAVDLRGRLFVGNTNGTIQVFTPPFATGNAPAFTLSVGAGLTIRAVALDTAQNLYVQVTPGSSVVVFTGPILGPQPSAFTIPGPGPDWGGVGAGP